MCGTAVALDGEMHSIAMHQVRDPPIFTPACEILVHPPPSTPMPGRFATNLSTTCADTCSFEDMFSLRRKGPAEKRTTTPSPVAASPHAGELKIGAFRPGWLPDDATERKPAARPQVRSS